MREVVYDKITQECLAIAKKSGVRWLSTASNLPVTARIEEKHIQKMVLTLEQMTDVPTGKRAVLAVVSQRAERCSRWYHRTVKLFLDLNADKWLLVTNEGT